MWHVISKGWHKAIPFPFGLHYKRATLSYTIKFDGSCRYKQIDRENDWNKVAGWSYGLHHKNSVRVAWRYNEDLDLIELCPYIYSNGKRLVREQNIITVPLDYEFNLMIHVGPRVHSSFQRVEKFAYLSVNNATIDMDITWGYDLGPYFGGNNPAPHTMKVYVKRITV